MNVLFVTSSCLATNPRLIKNYLYQRSCGHTCKILGFQFGNWSDEMTDELIKKYDIDCTLIPPTDEIYWKTLFAFGIQKLCSLLYKLIPSLACVAYASDKKALLLNMWLKNERFKADVIEAHNLPALYPAFKFSKKWNIPYGFDVEDYHPGEFIRSVTEKNRRLSLFKRILPQASFITAASPLIAETVDELLKVHKPKCITINNSFHADDFSPPILRENNDKIRFVWFSQTASYGRGLEFFIKAAQPFKEQLELVLIGSLDKNFEKEFVLNNSFISHQSPISQSALHTTLGNFDVGLATELSSSDMNREICLTNKLFAYLQSGLFVLATDTKAQSLFFDSKSEYGKVIEQSIEGFEKGIMHLLKIKDQIITEKLHRYSKSKQFSFENEVNSNENYLKF